MDVEEVQDLFDEDNDHLYGADEAVEDNRYDGVAGGGARLELNSESAGGEGATGGAEGAEGEGQPTVVKPKRVLKPQPKLDPSRITGPRGLAQLPIYFKDFQPKGAGNEFSDLDKVLKGMEHWAHRLYPKLPFDDVAKRITVLGKKMAVSTYMKKLRLDMVDISSERIINSDDEDIGEEDQTRRYDDGDEEKENVDNPDEAFERLMAMVDEQEADAADAEMMTSHAPPPAVAPPPPKPAMTDEQRERMIRNRQLAEERRRQKKMEQTMLSDQDNSLLADYGT